MKQNSDLIFKDEDYILGIWFTEAENFCNIMAIIYKGEKENSWEGTVRTRYYAKKGRDDPFSGKDKKTFFQVKKIDITENQMIDQMNDLFDHLSNPTNPFTVLNAKGPYMQDHVIVKGNFHDLMEKCKDKPWFHVKMEKNDDK